MNLPLNKLFDCVVMLTWSDWKTEPRSNRYHYATRLAKHWPVLFVQPDANGRKTTVESSGSEGIWLLHVPRRYDRHQAAALVLTLSELGYRRPLLWIYNPYFHDFIAACYSSLKVYHATEDYFVEGVVDSSEIVVKLRAVLKHTDLLIAVSSSLREHYLKQGGYSGESLLLSNGCDYTFWSAEAGSVASTDGVQGAKVALYQGGINTRLDWDLLDQVIASLPDWEFWFCGRLDPRVAGRWKQLLRQPNLRYFGELGLETLRDLAHRASVGIIPFVNADIAHVSMPLKAFEYVACGLPVVSTPIRALEDHTALFHLANGADNFRSALQEALTTRSDEALIAKRRQVAKRYDYDRRLEELFGWIGHFLGSERSYSGRYNVLVLYDPHSMHVNTIDEHLRSFSLHSRHGVHYAAATGARMPAADLSLFDVVVIHYCVRVNLEDHLSPANVRALREFPGLKILFLQDEYDTTETARRAIERLGIHVVYTCVPEPHIADVYPPHRFPFVEFVPTLTGFAPVDLPRSVQPVNERSVLIGYRGRNLPYWYGDLSREKLIIGQRMKQICTARKLPVDIAWDDAHRIYGQNWYRFLQSCKATLGSESGSNLFDDFGTVREAIEQALRNNPAATYEQLRPTLIAPHEGQIRMNQISPKIFEAIACRTTLILFDGEYSGVVKPNVHFIPLRKDFSNIDEVLTKLRDDAFLKQLTERAYQDVIESGRYSYQTFIERFDGLLDDHLRRGNKLRLISIVGGSRRETEQEGTTVRKSPSGFASATDIPLSAPDAALWTTPMQYQDWIVAAVGRVWFSLPIAVRKTLRPLLNRIRNK